MLRCIVVAALLCVASPAMAQVTLFQGPWNVHAQRASALRAVVVGRRPAGCPRRYCGCASGRYVGLAGRQWWLAANWLRLPRAAPAPGMAAARRGHVFVLKRHVGGNRWLVYDPNSGRGLTRIRVRSIAGYAIVNPRSGIYASARRR